MDPKRFDALVQSLARSGSRRRLLGALAAGSLVSLSAAASAKHGQSIEPAKCLAVGKRCSQPAAESDRHGHGKGKRGGKGKHHPPSCSKCCSRFGAAGSNGKPRCTCKGEGIACDNPSQCCSGDCRDDACTACPPDQVFCPDGCANLQTDKNNCGSCGAACASGQRCQDGNCICDGDSCPFGCCDGDGLCQRGTSNQDCGDAGLSCADCTTTDDVCFHQACCTPDCTGKCDGESDGCGGACGCPTGQFCASGSCVVGQGTCASGADFCADTTKFCDGRQDCVCRITTEGDTRCGGEAPGGGGVGTCGECASSDDCASLYPGNPGIFCLQGGTGCCDGTAPNGLCVLPCSS